MTELDQKGQEEFVFDFLVKHPLATLSTVSPIDEPDSAVVYTRVKSDLTCYFGTRSNTEKVTNITQNPSVALMIADEQSLETVQLRGTASVVTSPEEVHEVMEALRNITDKEKSKWMGYTEKLSRGAFKFDVSRWMPPVGQLEGGSYVFIKVVPKSLRYRRYDSDWKTGKKYTEYLIQKA